MKTNDNYVNEINNTLPNFDVEEKNGKYIVNSENSNFEYYVDPINKLVIATLVDFRDPRTNSNKQLIDAYRNITKDSNSSLFRRALGYANDIVVEYKGKAKCHTDDAFNISDGIEIARNRALEKYNKDEIARISIARWMLLQIERKQSARLLLAMEKESHYHNLAEKD